MVNITFKKYRITTDVRQYIVSKEVTPKEPVEDAEVNYSTIGYYSSLGNCFKGIKKDYILSGDTDIRSVSEYIRTITQLEDEFNQLVETTLKEDN